MFCLFLVRLCFLVRSTKTSPGILDSIYFHLSFDICCYSVSLKNENNKGKKTNKQTNKQTNRQTNKQTNKQMYGFQEQEKYVRQFGISYYRDIRFQRLFLRTKSTDTFTSEEAVVE